MKNDEYTTFWGLFCIKIQNLVGGINSEGQQFKSVFKYVFPGLQWHSCKRQRHMRCSLSLKSKLLLQSFCLYCVKSSPKLSRVIAHLIWHFLEHWSQSQGFSNKIQWHLGPKKSLEGLFPAIDLGFEPTSWNIIDPSQHSTRNTYTLLSYSLHAVPWFSIQLADPYHACSHWKW